MGFIESPSDYTVDVMGTLAPETLTVTSYTACSTMPTGGGPFFSIGDPENSVPSSMPGTAICPTTEGILKSQMQNNTCPLIKWKPENPIGEYLYHQNFDVYKELKFDEQWGAECAYYPATGTLVPNLVPGHGTANYWPDGTCGHFFWDPGGPWYDPISPKGLFFRHSVLWRYPFTDTWRAVFYPFPDHSAGLHSILVHA